MAEKLLKSASFRAMSRTMKIVATHEAFGRACSIYYLEMHPIHIPLAKVVIHPSGGFSIETELITLSSEYCFDTATEACALIEKRLHETWYIDVVESVEAPSYKRTFR